MKYLFTASFKDGSIIKQTQEDVSVIAPPKSAFYDILEKQKESPLVIFTLEDFQGGKTYQVNLESGEFFVNGVPFRVNFDERETFNRRIIYFRRNILIFKGDELESHTIYFLGWQGNLSPDETSPNVQQVISFE